MIKVKKKKLILKRKGKRLERWGSKKSLARLIWFPMDRLEIMI
jgi:hypothetical protein